MFYQLTNSLVMTSLERPMKSANERKRVTVKRQLGKEKDGLLIWSRRPRLYFDLDVSFEYLKSS